MLVLKPDKDVLHKVSYKWRDGRQVELSSRLVIEDEMRVEEIGTIGVDSGSVLIVDPGMAKHVRLNRPPNFPGEQIKFPGCVSVASGYGDGDYPVYAIFNDKDEYVGALIVWDSADAVIKDVFEWSGFKEVEEAE